MKLVYMAAWVLVSLLLSGTVGTPVRAAQPLDLPHVDYDCDGEITVNDALILVNNMDRTDPVSLWAYDLDKDGQIDIVDARIVMTEFGRTDLPQPVWCE